MKKKTTPVLKQKKPDYYVFMVCITVLAVIHFVRETRNNISFRSYVPQCDSIRIFEKSKFLLIVI